MNVSTLVDFVSDQVYLKDRYLGISWNRKISCFLSNPNQECDFPEIGDGI